MGWPHAEANQKNKQAPGCDDMRKMASVLAVAFACSGCAAPLPLTIASLLADGVSYATTEKSITDHGLSALSDQDCAIYRLLTEGSACRDSLEETQVVENKGALGNLTPKRKPAIPSPRGIPAQTDTLKVTHLGTIGAPLPGVYMVIASSRDLVTARTLGLSYNTAAPQVFAMPTGDRRVAYHVIVGPVTHSDYPAAQKTAASHGFSNTWALRINASDWQLDKELKQRATSKMTASINL